MIISRTPLRISFFGGGTDLPQWYNSNRGKVISTAINKFNYITVRYLPPFFDYNFRIRYFIKEEVKTISSIKHPSVRETLKFLKFHKKLEVIHNSDLPALSGLGSSSSFTVGLLNCLNTLLGRKISKNQLFLDAINIEQDKIKEAVGSQDQTICALGGANIIKFSKSNISYKRIPSSNNNLKKLEKSIFLIFTGYTRKANDVEKEKIKNLKKNYKFLSEILNITDDAEKKIYTSKDIVSDYAELMNKYWWYKKKLSRNVTNKNIEKLYNFGLDNGAYAGKIVGAGGGGFLVFLINPKKKDYFKKIFKKFTTVPIQFENSGSKIIYNNLSN